MHRIMSDPVTMRWWSSLPHRERAETQEWLDRMIAAPDAVGDDFIVERDGEVIGKLGAWRLPEIGFLLAREAQGKGYASEALAAFIAHRFARGSDWLVADVDPANAASLRLLGRHGFRITGRAARTWLIGGVWHDSIYLRLDAPQPSGRVSEANTRSITPA